MNREALHQTKQRTPLRKRGKKNNKGNDTSRGGTTEPVGEEIVQDSNEETQQEWEVEENNSEEARARGGSLRIQGLRDKDESSQEEMGEGINQAGAQQHQR